MLKTLITLLLVGFVVSDDVAKTFQQQFTVNVVPPFKEALTTYENAIIKKLASTPAASIQSNPSAVAKSLNCATDKLANALRRCVASSDTLRKSMDTAVQQMTAQGTHLAQQMASLQKEQQANNAQKTSLEAQIKQATTQVQQAQNALNAAVNTLNQEQKRYDTAKDSCIGHALGKRDIWHHIKHGIEKGVHQITKPIEKAICRTLNTGGIDRAKDARNRAQSVVNNARARLAQLQTQLNQLNQHIAEVNTAIGQVAAQQKTVAGEVAQLNVQRNSLNVVDTQVKSAESKVSMFLGKTEVLKDAVTHMMEFEAVLVPLNAIAKQMPTFNQQVSPLAIPPATIASVTSNLRALSAKLPSYPFVENVPGC